MNRPRTDRRRPTGWMDGYTNRPSLEATCQALEDRLMAREGRRVPFTDAIAREPLELDWWAL
jgi:hypothetical protein